MTTQTQKTLHFNVSKHGWKDLFVVSFLAIVRAPGRWHPRRLRHGSTGLEPPLRGGEKATSAIRGGRFRFGVRRGLASVPPRTSGRWGVHS